MCFERKRLEDRLQADKNVSRSLMAVDIHGHQRGGFCIVPNRYGNSTALLEKLLGVLKFTLDIKNLKITRYCHIDGKNELCLTSIVFKVSISTLERKEERQE